ncbi:N-acetylmuramoyl-L-alanine amidase [Selenomonadales bacterium OttesenSCG-928-I06]|nr:N-acetylmuramoyl-L-alanine amidase [Selenomonadales bacterium OttesenSCG-928-I06]
MRIIIDGKRLPGNIRTNRDLLITLRNIANTLNWGIRYDAAREIVLINSQDSTLPSLKEERVLTTLPQDESSRLNGKVIAIDPGHGGKDLGSIGPTGTLEKDNTLAIALILRDLLEKNGATTILTREDDQNCLGSEYEPLEEIAARTAVANENQVDIFVSIHNDYFESKNSSGATTFYYGDRNSKRLAECVQESISDALGIKDCGIRFGSFYILRYTKMPSISVEIGFISNPVEEMLLASNDGRKNAAEGIFEGIVKYFKV